MVQSCLDDVKILGISNVESLILFKGFVLLWLLVQSARCLNITVSHNLFQNGGGVILFSQISKIQAVFQNIFFLKRFTQ